MSDPVSVPRQRPGHDRHIVAVGLLLLALLCSIAALHPASAQDNVLSEANTLLANGDPEAAYLLLAPLESERAGEPAFDYLLGIAALDTGRHTQAVFALERVLAMEPDNALARAEIARAYLKLGERKTAERELETVRARSDVPDDAKAAIEKYLAAFRASQGEAMSWRAHISATLGYDSNVNSATADDTIAVLGSAFQLAPSSQERSDFFGRLGAGASVVIPVSMSTALIGGVSADTRINKDERDFDQSTISTYGGINVRDGHWTYTGVLQYGTFRLDRDAFRNAFGATLQARRALDASSQVSGYGQITRLSYPTQSVRNAFRYVLGGAYSRALATTRDAVLFAGAYVAAEDELAENASHLGHRGIGMNLGGEVEITSTAKLIANGGLERRDYGGTEPLFGNSRRDTRYSLALGVDYEPIKNWLVSPSLRWVRNDSNISVNDYDRATVEITVRREFGN